MSLTSPHKLWTTAGKKSYEVAKDKIQLLFLSTQYPCAQHSRHWIPENPQCVCSYPVCQEIMHVESPEHVLLHCPAYTDARAKMIVMCLMQKDPESHHLNTSFLLSNSAQKLMQFLLDCSAIPEVLRAEQLYGEHFNNDLFY